MIKLISRYSKTVTVGALIGLVIAEGFALAAPCYTRSGGNVGCFSQGGPGCTVLSPVPSLPCPGGPWTIDDCVSLGLNAADPCNNTWDEWEVPRKYATLGNEKCGYMEQDYQAFVCTTNRTCTKQESWLPPPYLVRCAQDPPFLARTSQCLRLKVQLVIVTERPIWSAGQSGRLLGPLDQRGWLTDDRHMHT